MKLELLNIFVRSSLEWEKEIEKERLGMLVACTIGNANFMVIGKNGENIKEKLYIKI